MTEYESAFGRDSPGLTVGFVRGVTLTKWTRIWAERFPDRQLRSVAIDPAVVASALDQQQLDMAFARLPLLTDPGLRIEQFHVIPLYVETPVVLAPADHPIAAFDEVSLSELADEATIDPDQPDAVDLVAGGAGVMLIPQSVARTISRRDLVHRPITDGAPTQMGLIWGKDSASELIEDFVGIVRGRTANSSRSRRDPAPPVRKKRTPEPRRPTGSRRRPRR